MKCRQSLKTLYISTRNYFILQSDALKDPSFNIYKGVYLIWNIVITSGGKRQLGDNDLLTSLERILELALRVLTRTICVLEDAPMQLGWMKVVSLPGWQEWRGKCEAKNARMRLHESKVERVRRGISFTGVMSNSAPHWSDICYLILNHPRNHSVGTKLRFVKHFHIKSCNLLLCFRKVRVFSRFNFQLKFASLESNMSL